MPLRGILSAAKKARRSVPRRNGNRTPRKREKGGVGCEVRARGRIRNNFYVGPAAGCWWVLLYEAVGSDDSGQGC